jgi:hypothetical protein
MTLYVPNDNTPATPPGELQFFLEHRGQTVYVLRGGERPLYTTDLKRRPRYTIKIEDLPCYDLGKDGEDHHREILQIAIEADVLICPPELAQSRAERIVFSHAEKLVTAHYYDLTEQDRELLDEGVGPARALTCDGGEIVTGVAIIIENDWDAQAIRDCGYSDEFLDLYVAARRAGARWLLIEERANPITELGRLRYAKAGE